MTMADWWLPELRTEIEQGDLIATGLQIQPIFPVKFLVKGQTSKSQKNTWEETDGPPPLPPKELPRILASADKGYALILSFGCEIDKPNTHVLLAPVYPLSKLDKALHPTILAQKAWRYMPVVDLPSDLGHGYAHLSKTFSLAKRHIEPHSRIKSMTDDAIFRLQAQLVGFYTRKMFPA